MAGFFFNSHGSKNFKTFFLLQFFKKLFPEVSFMLPTLNYLWKIDIFVSV